ncbi:MAG: hypothetical protein QNJ31_02530 [Candidatus Caenarcaniphilales bacterium]|nr:hypothetical protein [Candidatus Caenarcaniphilales bacterium]
MSNPILNDISLKDSSKNLIGTSNESVVLNRELLKLIFIRWSTLSSTWFLGACLWSVCPLFQDLITADTKNILWNCSFVYCFLGLVWEALFASFFKEKYVQSKSNSVEFFKFIASILKNKHQISIPEELKFSLLFLVLRIFYLPLMLNTFVIHLTTIELPNGYNSFLMQISEPTKILKLLYFFDVLPFALAYLLNFGNFRTRSVDTTFVGWFFCLICYPPFNESIGQIFPFQHSDYTGWWAWISLSLISIYVWASLALGLRAGHLQYRGLCDSGPYSFVRHPAYAFKTMSWWVGTIAWTCLQISSITDFKNVAVLVGWNIVSAVVWTWIYHQRALSEERHLFRYTEYKEYCRRVKYRYIPFVI